MITLERAGEIVAGAVGREPSQVLATDRPYVYQARFEGRTDVVVKGAHPGLPAGRTVIEAWAYSRAREVGVPAPVVIAASDGEDPDEYLVAEWIEGPTIDHAPRDRRDALIEETGEYLRHLHTVSMVGFGYADPDHYRATGEIRGKAGSWCPFVAQACAWALPHLAQQGCVDQETSDGVIGRLEEHAHLLNDATGSHLLHGDMHSWHIITDEDGSSVRGLIDFGDLTIGDPSWDLARFALYESDAAVERMAVGYGRDAIGDDDLRLKIPLYRVSAAAVVAAWAHSAGFVQAVPRIVESARFHEVL